MNGKRFLALFEKEYREFYSSKSWLLALALPLFIGFLFNFVYREADRAQFTVAYMAELSPTVQQLFKQPQIKLVYYPEQNQAFRALNQGTVDAVIASPTLVSGKVMLLANKTEAKKVLLLTNAINVALLQAYSNNQVPQIKVDFINSQIQPRWLSIPLWLIQLILTVCLLQTAAAIADEKEKQTLHAVLVSPATLAELISAKLTWAALVGVISILITLWLTHCPSNVPVLLVIAILGALIYAIQALLIGLFTPNALLARTLATVLYLLSTFPLMVADLAITGKELLVLFPSYLVWRGFEQAVLMQSFSPQVTALIASLILECLALGTILVFWINKKADF